MVIYPISHLPPEIPIGVQTETGAKEVRFDISSWREKWPDLTYYVWVKRPTETVAYPVPRDAVRLVGDVLEWYVSDADTAIPGNGTVEIEGSAEDIRVLTGEVRTTIRPTSRATTSEPPDPIKSWYDNIMTEIDKAGTIYVTATIGEAYSETHFRCTFDKTGAEVVEALKAGKTALCLLDIGDGIINVFPLVGYQDNGYVNYRLQNAEMAISIGHNADKSGDVRIEILTAPDVPEVRPTTPIYVTSDVYSVTTCNMTFAEIAACLDAGTLGMPIVWEKDSNGLINIPITIQTIRRNDVTITYYNEEGHGLYHNHDDSIGLAYNDSLT